MRKHKLIWFGHILHMHVDAPVRRGECYQEDDIRNGRGTPKITWGKIVQKDLLERKIT